MYNNPFYNNFREPQQPIQNIINTQLPNSDMFSAQYLKENQKVEEIFIMHKTAFIDLKNKELKIKELNGEITTYGLILPKDEKDIKIETLERQINELKGMMVSEQFANATTDNEITQQDTNVKKSNRK